MNLKLKATSILFLGMVSLLPVAQAATLTGTLSCKAICATEQGDSEAASCSSEKTEVALKDAAVENNAVNVGGWDGDQMDQQSFALSDVQALLAGKAKAIVGTETSGFNHGPDFIATWSIVCSKK